MKRAILAVALLLIATQAPAAGRGQGAIVLRDNAPVYVHSDGPDIEWKMKRGDAVCGMTSNGILAPTYLFDEVNGRYHVVYFQGEQKGMSTSGWMDPKDLAKFTYDGGCQQGGSPVAMKGFSQRWNACFEEGRDNKLEVLQAKWDQEKAAQGPTPTPTPLPPPPPLTVGCNLYGEDGGLMGTVQEIGAETVMVVLKSGVKIKMPLSLAQSRTRSPVN